MSEPRDFPDKAASKPGSRKKGAKDAKPRAGAAVGKDAKPEWADGLKRLYDSVVDEPLPDAFRDLLSRLDDDQP
ncbi:MAG TPA: NepR family anti-sigma factor [Sphingomonadaceae bacterium]|nr:NepR family anti-sigma factor [Sphingomonadaceae bacterium]